MSTSKMYIAVLDEFPDHMVPTVVAHAVLGHHQDVKNVTRDEWKGSTPYQELYDDWIRNSFKKCVVRVNQKEFGKIAALPNVGLFHENKTLGGKKACAVLVVGNEIPNVLKFAHLWEPAKF